MKKHLGGCHCGKVRFETEAQIDSLMACNCSICAKKGWLLAFVPEKQFKLVSGKQDLTNYQFGKKTIDHGFCSHCGISSFSSGADDKGQMMYAVNARCLDDFDLKGIKVQEFDGKHL